MESVKQIKPKVQVAASSKMNKNNNNRQICLCLIFIAINLIAICVSYAAAGEHHYEEPKHKFHPYKYGYKVIDHKGNKQWKQEESHSPMEVKGSYGYKDKHGLFREVSYIADKHGFRAKIKTNELQGKIKNPANVEIINEPHYSGGGHGHGHGAASQVHTVQAAALPPARTQSRLAMPMAAAAAAPTLVAAQLPSSSSSSSPSSAAASAAVDQQQEDDQ